MARSRRRLFKKCCECGEVLNVDLDEFTIYGNGAVRCWPECVEMYRRRLNKRRGPGGRFERKG